MRQREASQAGGAVGTQRAAGRSHPASGGGRARPARPPPRAAPMGTLPAGSPATARWLSASNDCCVFTSTPDSQQPKPGWEWYQPTTISGLGREGRRAASRRASVEPWRRESDIAWQGMARHGMASSGAGWSTREGNHAGGVTGTSTAGGRAVHKAQGRRRRRTLTCQPA